MVVEYHGQWNKKFDNFLREWYNSKVKIDPAMLVLGLKRIGYRAIGKGMGSHMEKQIINRLSELGLRKKRTDDKYRT